MKYAERQMSENQRGTWNCPSCHQCHVGELLYYWRAFATETNDNKKFIFYDFETRQDHKTECEIGYKPSNINCKMCSGKTSKYLSCKLCQNWGQSLCGTYQHIVNVGVVQSSYKQC